MKTQSDQGLQVDVSIIVVNWNGCDLVRQCLTTVYGETKGIRFEVIVVDNQSSDGSVDMLRSEFPQTKVIASEVNLGFAAGNNVGMAAASSASTFTSDMPQMGQSPGWSET